MAQNNRVNVGLGVAAMGVGAIILLVLLGKKASGQLTAALPPLPPRPPVKPDSQNVLEDGRNADPDVDTLNATAAQNQAARDQVTQDIPVQQGASLDQLLR